MDTNQITIDQLKKKVTSLTNDLQLKQARLQRELDTFYEVQRMVLNLEEETKEVVNEIRSQIQSYQKVIELLEND